jgi:hypothetical protein
MSDTKNNQAFEITPPPGKRNEGGVREAEEFSTPPPSFPYRQRRSDIGKNPTLKLTILDWHFSLPETSVIHSARFV